MIQQNIMYNIYNVKKDLKLFIYICILPAIVMSLKIQTAWKIVKWVYTYNKQCIRKSLNTL